VAAAELLRVELPTLQVLLALASTGPESEQYLADLRRRLAASSWIRFATAPYDELGALLGRATVLCVPHPPSPYWDAVQPIKLFDSMAAGRPIATTPRTATVAVVEHDHAGVVARGESASDFAEAIGPVLADRELAERLGRNARQAVVRDYDWQVISGRLSATLQLRTDPLYVPRTLARTAWRRVRPAGRPGAP
jgi:teichuronic acid biosynthesis glycosyltransferase TuaH